MFSILEYGKGMIGMISPWTAVNDGGIKKECFVETIF
jgi:hypothetical protein